jgi:acetamidase/formamidase
MSRHHSIPIHHEHMLWGELLANKPAVLTVQSGDTVTLGSFPAGGKDCLPEDLSRVPDAYMDALNTMQCRGGPHFVTGPVYVEGAQPGDVLQVDILSAELTMDWGYMAIEPLLGSLPDEFTDYQTIHPSIDSERGVMTLPWGTEIDLDPFFGVLSVAPPAAWGRCTSSVPRAFGGNMDNKALKPGCTLYLPVFNAGAQFFAGDGHGVQGDGEVCLTALETGIRGTFRLSIRRDFELQRPFAESPTQLISIGIDEDLDDAAKQAVREMVLHICRLTSLTREQAYMLCSVAGDLHVTQLVDGNKGVHMLLPKRYL